MKTLVFSLLVLSNVSFAASKIAGNPVAHTLKCKANFIPFIGSDVNLKVTTQALAPEYSVREISVSQKALAPDAKAVVTTLKQASQTAYNATFKAKGIKVLLDKSAMTAELSLGAIDYVCKK